MNIFVCVKQVPDTETKIIPTSDGSFIETASIKWIMNPYDEYAVEQALLIKTTIPEANVTVVRVGSVKDTEALRTAMAMGADEASHVEAGDNLDSYSIAKALKVPLRKRVENQILFWPVNRPLMMTVFRSHKSLRKCLTFHQFQSSLVLK